MQQVQQNPLKEALSYLWWFYTPFRAKSVSDIYELISTNAYSGDGLYLNLGYWKEADNIDDACRAMARLCADQARLNDHDELLDVGFGFADQDMYWMEHYGPRRIVGLNITHSQVELARQRVAERGMSDRIELLEASATDMPLQDETFDKVIGLECAFHFNTRERFFTEARRVLRPGGRLVLTDVIRMKPMEGAWQRLIQRSNWNFFSKKYVVPEENADTQDTYAEKLQHAGFVNIRVESIREQVYPQLHHYMATDPEMLKRFHFLARLPYYLALRFDASKVYIAYDYVLVSAEKPA
ncbi:MAG: class I SAM-dependent methyltransferase [Candidatus Competibacteraceae bacterium]|nr:class I SAM-dependent methyltransferase [Candidatus Competibacteraceae bacterium]